MKVALIHYHLRTGGVTQVLLRQVAALAAAGVDALVLSAGPPSPAIHHVEVASLDYCRDDFGEEGALYTELATAARNHFGSLPDLWHIHNPTLGKNSRMPALVDSIAESGIPLVLQIHDFAEDSRAENYPLLRSEKIYPIAPHIHYAFINSRDQTLLTRAGLPAPQYHLLPNTVAVKPHSPQSAGLVDRLVLYPVRGIRRKNLGELVLLAALAPPKTRFAISLAPENPAWLEAHNRWEKFAEKRALPILFDVTGRIAPVEGCQSDFESWCHTATHLITTSVAEGFGLTFLEPIARRKPLFGRDIPEITADFRAQGIEPGHLYHKIAIPLEAVDAHALRQEMCSKIIRSYELYRQVPDEDFIEQAWLALTKNEEVDFANLPESFQEKLIKDLLNPTLAPLPVFTELRKWLSEALAKTSCNLEVETLAHYSASQSGERLVSLYRNAIASPSGEVTWLPKEKVLAQFLQPERFHFLRS